MSPFSGVGSSNAITKSFVDILLPIEIALLFFFVLTCLFIFLSVFCGPKIFIIFCCCFLCVREFWFGLMRDYSV